MTTLSLGTVRHLSSGAVIESLLIPEKMWGAENRTRVAGAQSLNATAVLWRPLLLTSVFIAFQKDLTRIRIALKDGHTLIKIQDLIHQWLYF